jgi:hypothetical protein
MHRIEFMESLSCLKRNSTKRVRPISLALFICDHPKHVHSVSMAHRLTQSLYTQDGAFKDPRRKNVAGNIQEEYPAIFASGDE